jgi:integrase
MNERSIMDCIKCQAPLPEGAVFCPTCGKKQTTTTRKGRRRANGEGSVYKRGSTWEAAVVLGYKLIDGKAQPDRRTKGGFKTKKEAIDYLPTLKEEKKRNVPTLNDLWYQYQTTKYKKLSQSRQEKYRIAWPKMESVKYCRIDMLVVSDLQKVIDEKASSYYPARDIRDLFSILYQTAMPDQFVSVNLAEYLTLPDLNTKEREAFSAEEIQKLWEDYGAGNWWTGYILLMIYTGMMPGELLDARKSHIDWDNKKIQGAGKKTDERKATPIVLADVIVPVLKDLCAHTAGEKIIAINKDNFYTRYYETITRAGCRKLKPYSCRHTAATSLALENVAPSVIQKVMRHAKFSTTEQYIHVDIDPMLDAVNKLQKKKTTPIDA